MSETISITDAQQKVIEEYGIIPLFNGLEADVHGIVRRKDGDERIVDYAVSINGTIYEVTYRCIRDGKGA